MDLDQVSAPVPAAPPPAPDPVKPGWQSSEAWITAVGHVIAALGVLGILSQSDTAAAMGWLGKAGAAAGVLVVMLWQGAHYTRQRIMLKKRSADNGSFPLALMFAVLTLLFLGSPLPAQPATPVVRATAAVRTDAQIGLFNFHRPQPQQQAVPQQQLPAPTQTDPVVMAALMQLQSQNAQIIALLMAQRQTAPSSPASPTPPSAGPQFLLLPGGFQSPGAGPQQSLPIQGAPQQILPIQGAPQQSLPIAGQPQQALPIQGAPQQHIQIFGSPQQSLPIAPQGPQQQLPPAPAPQQLAAPAPTPIAPTPPSSQPLQQQLPTAPASPVGFQRYTVWRPQHR